MLSLLTFQMLKIIFQIDNLTTEMQNHVYTNYPNYDALIFNDGGEKIFNHFDLEVNTRKKQHSSISVIYKKEAGKYLFRQWNSSEQGDAVKLWQFMNNCADRKTAYAEVVQFLRLDSKSQEFLKIEKNQYLAAYINGKKEKTTFVNPNKNPKKAKIEKKKILSKLDHDYWYKKTSWQKELDVVHGSLDKYFLDQGMVFIDSAQIYTESDGKRKVMKTYNNLNCVFGLPLIKESDDLRIIQPLCSSGHGYYIGNPKSKRAALPNFDHAKSIYPNFKFSLGLNTFFDLSKPIYWVSGESDYFAMRAHGFQVICLGGEGMKFNEYLIEIMREHGYGIENLTILFDNDDRGIEFAKIASAIYQIPYIRLPKFNENIKDVCDLFSYIFDEKNFKGDQNYQTILKDFKELCLLDQFRFFSEKSETKEIELREKYLSNDLLVCNAISKEIVENHYTVLDCGAGVGKTYFSLNFLIDFLKKQGTERILFLVPTQTLAQQIENQYKGLICLYEGKKLSDQDDYRVVVATYDSYPKYLQISQPQIIIIDEAHMVASESDYRKIMNDIFDLTNNVSNAKTLLLSATHNDFLNNEYKEFAAANDKKFVHLKVNSKEKETIKLIDSSYSKDGLNLLLKTVETFLNVNQYTDKKLVVFSNSKKLNWKIAKILIDLGLISEDQIGYFHAQKQKNTETRVMKSIRESGFISENIKIVFVTSIFIQGINIYNENIECIAFARNFRQTDSQMIQFLNRFRNCQNLTCHMIMPKIKKAAKNLKLESTLILCKKQTALNVCKTLNQLEISSQEKEVFYGKNEFAQTNYIHKSKNESEVIYSLSNAYVALQLEKAKQDSLNTEQYLNEIVKNGRGIFLKKDHGGDGGGDGAPCPPPSMIDTDFEIIESTITETIIESKITDTEIKKVNKKLDIELKEIENQVLELLENDIDKIVNTVIEKSADKNLKKNINQKFAISDESGCLDKEFINKPHVYETIEKHIKRFLQVSALNEILTNSEIIDLLKKNKSNKDFRILLTSLSVAKMHKNRNIIKMKAALRNGRVSFLNIQNIILFQINAIKLFEKICFKTQKEYSLTLQKPIVNSLEQQRHETALKRSILWDKKTFLSEFKKELKKIQFHLFKDFENYSENDLFDLLRVLFEIEFETVDLINFEGKKKKIKLLVKMNPIFDWNE